MSQLAVTTGLTHTNNTVEGEYIPCTRKGCTDIGIYKLLIILVNKTAYFCATHKKELEDCGLVESDNSLQTLEMS